MAECSSGRILAHGGVFGKSHSKVPLVSRSRDLFVPPIALDRRSSMPLHRQVGTQIAGTIRRGVVAGARLPSTRALARLLGVSRNTVITAYDDLVAAGLIQGRRGAGMMVAIGSRGMPALDPAQVLKDAQYPVRTLHIVDPDGTPLYLAYR
jgi:DNA-binding transcriptional regulator YhcF (GntR family)